MTPPARAKRIPNPSIPLPHGTDSLRANRSTPKGNLASVGVGPLAPRARGNPGIYAEEDVTREYSLHSAPSLHRVTIGARIIERSESNPSGMMTKDFLKTNLFTDTLDVLFCPTATRGRD